MTSLPGAGGKIFDNNYSSVYINIKEQSPGKVNLSSERGKMAEEDKVIIFKEEHW